VVLGAPVSEKPYFAGSRALLPAALGAALVLLAAPARADVSSWASVAAGPTWLNDGVEKRSVASLQMEAGIGIPPTLPIVVGGLFHLETHFSQGSDLGLLARFATQNFVLGDWGGAIDVGPYTRFWGRGSTGGLAKLVLGAPWGLELGLEGGIGTHDARFFGVTFGIDFARLTVFRTVGENYFPNPYPAYRKVD
jgi:hypothetical protein